jgi:hypothetical protein
MSLLLLLNPKTPAVFKGLSDGPEYDFKPLQQPSEPAWERFYKNVPEPSAPKQPKVRFYKPESASEAVERTAKALTQTIKAAESIDFRGSQFPNLPQFAHPLTTPSLQAAYPEPLPPAQTHTEAEAHMLKTLAAVAKASSRSEQAALLADL